jgi:hypothetical protein
MCTGTNSIEFTTPPVSATTMFDFSPKMIAVLFRHHAMVNPPFKPTQMKEREIVSG